MSSINYKRKKMFDKHQVMIYNFIMQLRSYQSDIISEARSLMRQNIKNILVVAPTGSGKTVLVAHMMKTAASKGLSSMFLVHRRELVKQSIKAFAEVGVNHGVIANGWQQNNSLPIQIASVQTLVRRMDYFKKPSLVIYDECHHHSAGTWRKISENYKGAYSIGLTATPYRLDGSGLEEFYDIIVEGPTVRTLIDQGYLSPYKMFAPSNINISGLHIRMGDFVKSETESLFDKPTITGDAIKHYKKLCPGKRAVVFCTSIKHSEHVVSQFNSCGILAKHIDGNTPIHERDKTINDFRNGKIKIISNVDIISEGFDLPAIEAVILLRPTQSLGLYLQQCGRALRPVLGKEFAYIIDHAGNCQRHGLPDDDRKWTLKGNKGNKKDSESEIKVKTCPKCYAVQVSGSTTCKFCGHIYELKERKVNHVEGELVEVDYEKLRKDRLKSQGKCQSKEDLVEEGKRRGYKHPRKWAHYVWQARQRKKNAGNV